MKRQLLVCIGLALAPIARTPASINPPAVAGDLPVSIADNHWQPLAHHRDTRLQMRLELQLRRHPEWQELVDRRKMAVGLVDMSDPMRPRYAQVNGGVEMYAASLPKIAILLAAFDAFDSEKLERTPEIEADMTAMIRVSSNKAATRMIDRLGGLGAVNSVLKDQRYDFYSKGNNGGLWVGKRYAKTGPRVPDPLHGISHAATVDQVARFYYQLATGRLISEQASRDMLTVLSNPGINHKFVKALHERDPAASLYRKSGTWRDWHADSVLVWGEQSRRYILVGLIEDGEGEQILRQLVPAVETALGHMPQGPKTALR